jgi:hypothetical protein
VRFYLNSVAVTSVASTPTPTPTPTSISTYVFDTGKPISARNI